MEIDNLCRTTQYARCTVILVSALQSIFAVLLLFMFAQIDGAQRGEDNLRRLGDSYAQKLVDSGSTDKVLLAQAREAPMHMYWLSQLDIGGTCATLISGFIVAYFADRTLEHAYDLSVEIEQGIEGEADEALLKLSSNRMYLQNFSMIFALMNVL